MQTSTRISPEDISVKRQQEYGDDSTNKQQLTMIEDEIRSRLRRVKTDSYTIGGLLTEANVMMPTEKFLTWASDSFGLKKSSIYNLMNVYKYCFGRPEIAETFPPSVLYRLASRNCPNDLRKYLFDNGEYVKDIKVKEIQKIFNQLKAGEIDLESPEIKSLVFYDGQKDQSDSYQELQKECFLKLEKLLDATRQTCKSISWPVPDGKQTAEFTQEQINKWESLHEEITNTVYDVFHEKKYNIVESLDAKFFIVDENPN